jgi:hypothetical protein|uniref:Uncharacterized protein n=1 Tax=Caudovirales sp. ctCiv1 TaxID=2826769 RepID=A0A8S5M9C2_9CAUD|nr:hypothetical protein [uncultured Lachnoclostridium sp.]DAD78555.1 MAG TPA: hypothetical protein [Caudovirales sp. ctCiv1]
MIKIIRGKYGNKLIPAGTILSLSAPEEQRLVNRKVAVFVCGNDDTHLQKSGIAAVNEKVDVSDEDIETTKNEVEIWPEEKIRKLSSKKKIIEYAQSIGLVDLDETMGKDDLVDEVLNYIDENYES